VLESLQQVSEIGIESVFGLSEIRCEEIEGEIADMFKEDIMTKKTVTSMINHVVTRYNDLEKIFAAYTIGMIIGISYGGTAKQ